MNLRLPQAVVDLLPCDWHGDEVLVANGDGGDIDASPRASRYSRGRFENKSGAVVDWPKKQQAAGGQVVVQNQARRFKVKHRSAVRRGERFCQRIGQLAINRRVT